MIFNIIMLSFIWDLLVTFILFRSHFCYWSKYISYERLYLQLLDRCNTVIYEGEYPFSLHLRNGVKAFVLSEANAKCLALAIIEQHCMLFASYQW